jgi:hypothetical protein
LEGGVDTGFNHVEPSIRTPHLYQVKGTKKNVVLKQVKTRRDALNEGDSFILDVEEAVYVWNGKEANQNEVQQAKTFATSLTNDRGISGPIIMKQGVDDDADEAKAFWDHLPGTEKGFLGIGTRDIEIESADAAGDDEKAKKYVPSLYSFRGNGKYSRVCQSDKIPGIPGYRLESSVRTKGQRGGNPIGGRGKEETWGRRRIFS